MKCVKPGANHDYGHGVHKGQTRLSSKEATIVVGERYDEVPDLIEVHYVSGSPRGIYTAADIATTWVEVVPTPDVTKGLRRVLTDLESKMVTLQAFIDAARTREDWGTAVVLEGELLALRDVVEWTKRRVLADETVDRLFKASRGG